MDVHAELRQLGTVELAALRTAPVLKHEIAGSTDGQTQSRGLLRAGGRRVAHSNLARTSVASPRYIK